MIMPADVRQGPGTNLAAAGAEPGRKKVPTFTEVHSTFWPFGKDVLVFGLSRGGKGGRRRPKSQMDTERKERRRREKIHEFFMSLVAKSLAYRMREGAGRKHVYV